jgi:hypothetical protein
LRYKYLIALVVIICCLPGLFLFNSCTKAEIVVEEKAAIVDQLYALQPNQSFIDQNTKLLTDSGYRVDVYRGDEVTVDFFRGIPESGYSVIIFRAHAGLLGVEGKAIQKTCVFTSEAYSESKHIPEQLSEKLAKARINEDQPWVFAVGSDFISHSARGKFNRTIIIMMGCSTAYINDLAGAFIDKGASVYVGWNASVGLDYMDSSTTTLLNKLFYGKVGVEDALAATMKEAGKDPDFGASLKYYPQEAGKKTVAELLRNGWSEGLKPD